MDQVKIEKSLNEREDDPVTDSGLVASLKFFDDYNHRGGRRSLREFLGHTWLRTLEHNLQRLLWIGLSRGLPTTILKED